MESEHDEEGELVYSPPPLDEVWLTEPERRERRERLREQRLRQEEILKVKNQRIPQTPFSPQEGEEGDGNLISDDEGDSESSLGEDKEPGGGIERRPKHPGLVEEEGDEEVLPPDQVQPPEDASPEGVNAPSHASEGGGTTPRRRSKRKRTQPQGSSSRWRRDAKGRLGRRDGWERDAGGRLRRGSEDDAEALINLSLSEAERKQFACTLGPKSVPPMANRLSRKKLKSRQRRALLQQSGDMALQAMIDPPIVEDLLASPLEKFIHLVANNCG